MKKHMYSAIYLIVFLTSVLSVSASSASILPGYIEVKGTTQNYVTKDKDGLVDFSIVIPALSAESLINFDLGKIISPSNDTINIFSYSIDVPSNLSLPQQMEKYIVSFTLDKSEFRTYFTQDGVYNMYALSGKFPISDVVKGFQAGKSIFELVSFFKFISSGVKTVPVKGDTSGLSIPIDQIQFNQTSNVTAPTYAKDKIMVSFSLFKNNNEFFPTDIKRVDSGKSADLTSVMNTDGYTLSLLMNNPPKSFKEVFEGSVGNGVLATLNSRADNLFSQLSYTLEKTVSPSNKPQFLPFINAPAFDKAKALVTAVAPKTVAGTAAYATHLVLSEVEVGGTTQYPIDFKKPVWSTSVMNWQGSFNIPSTVISGLISGKSYSWDVLYLATPSAESDSSINWSKVTHVTRHSVKF